MWFEDLMGFREELPEQVRENILIDGSSLISRVNNKEFNYGVLETPSLAQLRQKVISSYLPKGKISFREKVADVQQLHVEKSNGNALFQVASQFNLLEMVSPSVSPEEGIGGYEYDLTQGPACAIAAGAGTIYRNYFAPVNRQIGQTADNQIDCLADIGTALGNTDNSLWKMKNGYVLPTQEGLHQVNKQIKSLSESEIDELRSRLRVGIQWDTEVTLGNAEHNVSQAYCSALPVAYSSLSKKLWEPFARLILEASYEATVCAGILNSLKTGNNKVYLTLLGGGAFGNETSWIIDAIKRALHLYRNMNLDIVVVSYGRSNHELAAIWN